MYISSIKYKFMTIEEFLDLRFYDLNSILKANKERVKDTGLILEAMTNIIAKTNFNQLKNDVVFFKKENEHKAENVELFNAYNSLYSN